MAAHTETSTWCQTPTDLDRVLWSIHAEAGIQALDSADPRTATRIQAEVGAFLEEHGGDGHIVVKTSTAGDRSSNHEVSTSLLVATLEVVTGLVEPSRVLVADGPAVDTGYQAECSRLCWDVVAKQFGVTIHDLNEGPSTEVATGWPVSRAFLDADLVISLTKAKTHRRFGVSLAEKSLLGCLSGQRLGYPKLAGRHRLTVWLLQQIQRHSPPILSIIDGFRAIEGEGPLRGQPTLSHFSLVGRGCLGLDIRSAVEMGFDPALVPLFHRPYPRVPGDEAPNWLSLRISDVDFMPPRSCSWLYRSLQLHPRRRAKKYATLLEVTQGYWPDQLARGG